MLTPELGEQAKTSGPIPPGAADVCFGTVEDGRGGLGALAITRFPIPAHQTGRADFRRPAFRLASPHGTRRPERW